MAPSAAEIARTLAAGHLPGRLTMAALPADIPVAHATTDGGEVLIAVRPGSRAWHLLATSGEDAAAALTVEDVPPFPESPSHGRVHVCGWLHRAGDSARRAAPPLIAAWPAGGVFRLELGEVWVDPPDPALLDAAEFTAATPDPLSACERDLLLDLREHHAAELADLVKPHQHDGAAVPVRLDQYGLVLALPELYRVEFRSPADCPGCVAHALGLSHAHA